MEKAAAGRTGTRRRENSRPPLDRTVLLLGCCLAAPLWAQQPTLPPAEQAAEARAEQPLRVEIQASELPRLASSESGFSAPRVDLLLLPTNRAGLGLAIGMSGFQAGALPTPGYGPQRTTMDVGVHWRHTLQNQDQLDVMAWRRMTPPADAYTLIQLQQPVYGARVEMKLQPVRKAGLSFDRGIGFQLESGAKISIKRRNGGPMVYYRTTF